jgi:hypothetical protein
MIDLGKVLKQTVKESTEEAYLLIVRRGLKHLVGEGKEILDFYREQDKLKKDTKAFMYGKVVNKHARSNLCFSETHQEPDYAQKKGTVYAWDEVPLLKTVKHNLEALLPDRSSLVAEGNYYCDLQNCGIGFHGDGERKKVVGIRVGASFPLVYQWYFQSNPIGALTRVELGDGDIYFMSEKAVGWDWKKKTIHTLRHAAGAKKFITVKREIAKSNKTSTQEQKRTDKQEAPPTHLKRKREIASADAETQESEAPRPNSSSQTSVESSGPTLKSIHSKKAKK